jgi:hypothetical protein
MDTPTLTFTKVTATGAGSQGPASLATADGTQVRADPCVRITSGGTTNTMVFPDVSLRYNIYSLERTAKVDKLLCVPLPTAPRRSNLALETVEYPSDTVYDNSKRGDYSLDGSLVTCTHRYPHSPSGLIKLDAAFQWTPEVLSCLPRVLGNMTLAGTIWRTSRSKAVRLPPQSPLTRRIIERRKHGARRRDRERAHSRAKCSM